MVRVNECPKCGFSFGEPFEDCPRCGIVVAKVLRDQEEARKLLQYPRADHGTRSKDSSEESPKVLELLLTSQKPVGTVGLSLRLLLLVILFFWGIYLSTSPIESNTASESFLHLVNLPFHEAGHVFLSIFGQLVSSIGGTLGQLLVPALCLAVFLFKKRDPFAAAVCLWWFGENFLDIAPYINDARAGTLPLIGGNTGQTAPYGFHDWNFILNEFSLLEYDHALARTSVLFGTLLMITSLVWGGYYIYRTYQQPQPRLSWKKQVL